MVGTDSNPLLSCSATVGPTPRKEIPSFFEINNL